MEPVQTGTIHFKKSELIIDRELIGIQYHSDITRFIFLNKANIPELNDETCDSIPLQYAIFYSVDFQEALNWVKINAFLTGNFHHKIHGTGDGCLIFREKIESIFGLQLELVNEDLAIVVGHRIAFKQIVKDDFIRPPVEIESIGIFENKMFEKLIEGVKKRLNINKPNNSYFPCLLYYSDSICKCFYFDENGIGEKITGQLNGQKTFLGLSKLILETNSIDEVMVLASKGNRNKVDTQAKDIINNDIISPYGKFPPELPVFHFGKCADLNYGTEQFTKQDLAMSLVGMESHQIFQICGQICRRKQIPKIYLSGTQFKTDLIMKEIQKSNVIFGLGMDYNSLNLEYCMALGAMFCTDSDKSNYMK